MIIVATLLMYYDKLLNKSVKIIIIIILLFLLIHILFQLISKYIHNLKLISFTQYYIVEFGYLISIYGILMVIFLFYRMFIKQDFNNFYNYVTVFSLIILTFIEGAFAKLIKNGVNNIHYRVKFNNQIDAKKMYNIYEILNKLLLVLVTSLVMFILIFKTLPFYIIVMIMFFSYIGQLINSKINLKKFKVPFKYRIKNKKVFFCNDFLIDFIMHISLVIYMSIGISIVFDEKPEDFFNHVTVFSFVITVFYESTLPNIVNKILKISPNPTHKREKQFITNKYENYEIINYGAIVFLIIFIILRTLYFVTSKV